jgi:tRNA-uridine 2-sulfurtransferase
VKKTLVAVAMSGGIDSSVAAVKLKLEGYDVIGLTMKLWDASEIGGEDKHVSRHCCSLEMFDDARSVCFKYDIPHYVLNMHQDFNQIVIEDFISEYVKGRTPNPCVVCNYKIKWELLEHKTKQLGCDFLATGHYARICRDEASGRYQILKGVDATRDQSYFLWGLKQESLARTLFPLGELHKTEVRQLGREYGLINAEREESREICFVPDDDYARLVQARHPQLAQPGIIRDTGGNAVGTHEGYFHYTIGQRKKIQIATTEKRYVTRIIPEKNEIIVGSDDDLLIDTFQVTDINWVAIDPTTNPSKTQDPPQAVGHPHPALIKIRYLHKPVAGELQVLSGGDVEVHLSQKQRAVTPGQSCVFYDGDIVLGGGKIV